MNKKQTCRFIPDETDDLDCYSVFGGVGIQEYFSEYELSARYSYSPTEEEYAEYLADLETIKDKKPTDFN